MMNGGGAAVPSHSANKISSRADEDESFSSVFCLPGHQVVQNVRVKKQPPVLADLVPETD